MKYIIISLMLANICLARTGDVYYLHDVANQFLAVQKQRVPANDHHDNESELEEMSQEQIFADDEGKQDD